MRSVSEETDQGTYYKMWYRFTPDPSAMTNLEMLEAIQAADPEEEELFAMYLEFNGGKDDECHDATRDNKQARRTTDDS